MHMKTTFDVTLSVGEEMPEKLLEAIESYNQFLHMTHAATGPARGWLPKLT